MKQFVGIVLYNYKLYSLEKHYNHLQKVQLKIQKKQKYNIKNYSDNPKEAGKGEWGN